MRVAVVAIMALLVTGCAGTIQITYAVGKDAKASVRRQSLQGLSCEGKHTNLGPISTKTSISTDNKIVGPADTVVTTEPAPPPVMAGSRGGEIPQVAWWLAAWCFVSPTC